MSISSLEVEALGSIGTATGATAICPSSPESSSGTTLDSSSSDSLAPREKVRWFRSLPWFVRGDVDAFAGVFSNNLASMLAGAQMLAAVLPAEIVFGRIVPAVGLSMFCGSSFYVLQALVTAAKHGRSDMCCLPFGIFTPGLFAFNSGIIVFAVYYAEGGGEQAAELAWQVGVIANFVQGAVEVVLSPIGPYISQAVPMVALLGSLSSVGLAFLYADTLMAEFAWPLVTIAPFFLILAALLANVKIPHVPSTVLPILVGAAIAWISGRATSAGVCEAARQVGWRPANIHIEPFADAGKVVPYLGIAIPMALTVAIGTIQVRQMAANAGDSYNLRCTMFLDGMTTIIASLFGSPWGMTVFIGHSAFKAMGAQIGYTAMSGLMFLIVCFSGLSSLVLAVFPAEVLNPIILFVGLVVGVEALEITPPRHWPAFLVALVPGFFNWALQVASDFAAAICDAGFVIDGAVVKAGSLAACSMGPHAAASWGLSSKLLAVRSLGQGYILTSILWGAMVVHIVDRKFAFAAIWALIAAILSSCGLVHAEVVSLPWKGNTLHWEFVGGYCLTAAFLLVIELAEHHLKKVYCRCNKKEETELLEEGCEAYESRPSLDTAVEDSHGCEP